jgi:uncharacterized membrane protein YagU involved in acid resistance
MNIPGVLLWGFAATIVLTSTMAAGQGLGFSRMSIPFMVGTIFTPARDRAMVVGFGVHMVNGVIFALIYALVFESLGSAGWWLGAGMGVIHALFVLTVGMGLLPGLHPHMVSEYYGPTPNRLLQPPGFLALNYGRRTPLVTLVAHILYGAILGAFYRVVT